MPNYVKHSQTQKCWLGGDGECCGKKIVGGQTYHLVRNNDNDVSSSLGCKNSCSYAIENDTDLGKKYCFAPGKLEAKCLSSGGNLIQKMKR